MRRTAASVLVLLCVAGCGKRRVRDRVTPPDANTIDIATLQDLNESQNDLFEAIKQALQKPKSLDLIGTLNRQKVADMYKLLKPGDVDVCQGYWKTNSLHEEALEIKDGAGTCPIFMQRSWTYVNINGLMWTFNQVFHIVDRNFINLIPIRSFEADGNIYFDPKLGLTTGKLHFRRIKIKGKNNVNLDISVRKLVKGLNINGTVTLVLRADGQVATTTVSWNSDEKDAKYMINGKSADPKAFSALFSAYGLLEIVDRLKTVL